MKKPSTKAAPKKLAKPAVKAKAPAKKAKPVSSAKKSAKVAVKKPAKTPLKKVSKPINGSVAKAGLKRTAGIVTGKQIGRAHV